MNRMLLQRGMIAASSGRTRFALLALIVAACIWNSSAQAQSLTQPAPEKAFIANGGGDFGQNADNAVNDADRAYNVFFADMKQWGRYKLVSTPARADWIFQINAGNSPSCKEVYISGTRCGIHGHDSRCTYLETVNDFWIELVMMDAKTMGTRKTFREHLKGGSLLASAEARFDHGVAALVDDVQAVVGDQGTHTPVDQLPGPVPPQISSAKKIRLSDISEGDERTEKFISVGAPLLQVVAQAFQDWGRLELVRNREDADLLVDVSFSVHPGCYASFNDPTFRVFIRDPKSEALLWGITKHIEAPILGRNQRKNFDRGATNLVRNDLRSVVDAPGWTQGASIPAKPHASAAHVALASSSGALLSATISAPESVVKSGAPVKIAVAVKNSSKHELDFGFPEGDPLTCLIAVRNADGKLLPPTEHGRELQAAHASWRGRWLEYSLHPGETQRRECAVSEIYDISQAGKYFVQVKELDGRTAESNTLVLTVLP